MTGCSAKTSRAAGMDKLTVNGVSTMLGTDGGSDAGDVVVQVLEVKAVASGAKRVRLVVSDGAFWTNALAATQCYEQVNAGVEAHALIRLKKFSVSENGGKKFLIMLALEVVEIGSAVGARLGSPVEFGSGGG